MNQPSTRTTTRKTKAALLAVPAVATVALTVFAARAQAPAAKPAAAAAATNCKAYGGGKCCDAAVTAHLDKAAIFSACGESDATYLGEKGSKDTCRFMFKPDGKEEAFVEVYAPAAKEVPDAPTDPFFSWKKVGRVFITDKAKSPKSAPNLAAATGLWMPGKGFFVSVNASTKICTKAEAGRLAKSVK
jgi:hypothetical protein